MAPHLSTRQALKLIAEGNRVPPAKCAALQRTDFIRVVGHGPKAKSVLTDAGREALAEAEGCR